MLSGIGLSGLLLIVLVALILFGPSKLPQLGRAVGTTLSEFRRGSRELVEEIGREERHQAEEGRR
ncbi:twin-arginine translocase TatA/TatE family subunit [Paenibacillus elgii]